MQVIVGQWVADYDENKSVEATDLAGDTGVLERGLGMVRAGHEGV